MAKAPQALVGGQAVIEGVMMRAPRGVATAVRRPDGTIAVRYQDHVPLTRRFPVLGIPIVRGGVTLVESLVLGTSALTYSAEEASREEGKEILPPKPHENVIWGFVVLLSFALGFGTLLLLAAGAHGPHRRAARHRL